MYLVILAMVSCKTILDVVLVMQVATLLVLYGVMDGSLLEDMCISKHDIHIFPYGLPSQFGSPKRHDSAIIIYMMKIVGQRDFVKDRL